MFRLKGSLFSVLGLVIAIAAAAAVPAFAKGPHSGTHGQSAVAHANKGTHGKSGTHGNSGAVHGKSGTNGNKGGNSANAQVHVTICHAAPPDTFPSSHYVRISPSASGVYHGHLRQHSADIIPPFTYNGQTYSENWSATGQAIWNNGCVAPASTTTTDTTTATTTVTTTTTTTTSGTSGSQSSSGSKSGVASASSSSKSGVKGVKHTARPAKARVGAATFTG